MIVKGTRILVRTCDKEIYVGKTMKDINTDGYGKDIDLIDVCLVTNLGPMIEKLSRESIMLSLEQNNRVQLAYISVRFIDAIIVL